MGWVFVWPILVHPSSCWPVFQNIHTAVCSFVQCRVQLIGGVCWGHEAWRWRLTTQTIAFQKPYDFAMSRSVSVILASRHFLLPQSDWLWSLIEFHSTAVVTIIVAPAVVSNITFSFIPTPSFKWAGRYESCFAGGIDNWCKSSQGSVIFNIPAFLKGTQLVG